MSKDTERLENRVKQLEEYLERIASASEYFSQPGMDEVVYRYAHESNYRLAATALKGTNQ